MKDVGCLLFSREVQTGYVVFSTDFEIHAGSCACTEQWDNILPVVAIIYPSLSEVKAVFV
jgi:hypothetical protein